MENRKIRRNAQPAAASDRPATPVILVDCGFEAYEAVPESFHSHRVMSVPQPSLFDATPEDPQPPATAPAAAAPEPAPELPPAAPVTRAAPAKPAKPAKEPGPGYSAEHIEVLEGLEPVRKR